MSIRCFFSCIYFFVEVLKIRVKSDKICMFFICDRVHNYLQSSHLSPQWRRFKCHLFSCISSCTLTDTTVQSWELVWKLWIYRIKSAQSKIRRISKTENCSFQRRNNYYKRQNNYYEMQDNYLKTLNYYFQN